MSSGELLGELAAEVAALRRQESVVLARIVEAEREGAAIPFGTVAKLVADVARCGPAEARRLAERARALHDRVGLSGTPIPAPLPQTAAAYAEGAISHEHVDKIRALAEELPADVLAGDAWTVAERALAEHAREVGPRGLTRPIREMQARLDPDGQAPEERELAAPRRELRLTRRRNRVELAGFVDTETGIKLEALLDALGKPRSRAANGGEPDPRTTAERHGDALAEIIQLATTSGELPEGGGEPFTILLTAPEPALNQRLDGTEGSCGARTDDLAATAMDGTRIPAAQIHRIACDATVITKHGKPKRTAPPALRRALIARDQGCAHPDCDRPPALAQAHHIQHHSNDGPTTLDNMVLLCAHHHAMVHHTGWTVRLEAGAPRFTSPAYRQARYPLTASASLDSCA